MRVVHIKTHGETTGDQRNETRWLTTVADAIMHDYKAQQHVKMTSFQLAKISLTLHSLVKLNDLPNSLVIYEDEK